MKKTLQPRKLEEVIEGLKNNRKVFEKERDQLNLIGEKDYVSNLVYTFEQKGCDLLNALEAAENITKAIKIISREECAA